MNPAVIAAPANASRITGGEVNAQAIVAPTIDISIRPPRAMCLKWLHFAFDIPHFAWPILRSSHPVLATRTICISRAAAAYAARNTSMLV